jgi:DNA processing protein
MFGGRLEQQGLNRSLWISGNKINMEQTVGIVGTRHASPYGLKVAYEISKYYARKGYVVISGLAYGIDQKAHEGALSTHGMTVGVLGHGLNFHYPRSTKTIRTEIERTSFVITWYEPDQAPRKAFFRERNWLIAALSDFVIVVEAPTKSGALITANYALEMGKEVKAVPGDIDRMSSAGSNMLILEGAEPIVTLPESEEDKFRGCSSIQDLVAATGSLVDAGQLLARWQSMGLIKVEGEHITWIK